MSSTLNISYINVDHPAIGRSDVKETGSSRMFNWQARGGGWGGQGARVCVGGGEHALQPSTCMRSRALPACPPTTHAHAP